MIRALLSPIVIVLLIIGAILFTDLNLSQLQMTIYLRLISIMLLVAIVCFVVSELSRNYSQVDKLWSIIPLLYMIVIVSACTPNARIILMTVLVFLWGARLSYNFGRKGGYSIIPWKGTEDYRWKILREIPFLHGRLRWGLFNLFFISFYQHAIILLFTLPALVTLDGSFAGIGWIDILATILFLGFLIIETIADQQQYNFQSEKFSRLKSGTALMGGYAKGFLSSGLWRIVRHPNYTAEQAIWLSFYLFSVAATGEWFNWSILGALFLMLLFYGSSSFSEKISAGKYPEYRKYIENVPRFIPSLNFLNKKHN